MTNINDLGLPQGLPATWPYDPVNGLLVGSDDWLRNGREMTAADLGLPLPRWTREFVCGLYGEEWFERTYAEWLKPAPEAPYAFWLGAEDPDGWGDI